MLNFQAFVSAQQRWSSNTFGRGSRFEGIMKHIRKELSEIEADPSDPTEYADVIILVTDLAWRQGITPHQLTKALEEKQILNFSRVWNVAEDDQPCEHIEPVQADHSDLRAKALEAMKYLNEKSDLYVIDVSHQEGLPKSVQFVGGTFRITSHDAPLDRVWLQSAHSLINEAEILRAQKEAENA